MRLNVDSKSEKLKRRRGFEDIRIESDLMQTERQRQAADAAPDDDPLHACRSSFRKGQLRCGGFLGIVFVAGAPPRPQAADPRGDVAEIVEEADKALTARERTIERRHGACLARVFIGDP